MVGIPNVGKSTFINSYAGKASAKTGNKPGVTKGNQWIRLNKTLELLDTPGILWPRFESQEVGMHLALIGSINDQILDGEQLAMELIILLMDRYPEVLGERYGFENIEKETTGQGDILTHQEAAGILEKIGTVRGCLIKGGQCDRKKASDLLLDDFRSGRLGRITLEFPEEPEKSVG